MAPSLGCQRALYSRNVVALAGNLHLAVASGANSGLDMLVVVGSVFCSQGGILQGNLLDSQLVLVAVGHPDSKAGRVYLRGNFVVEADFQSNPAGVWAVGHLGSSLADTGDCLEDTGVLAAVDCQFVDILVELGEVCYLAEILVEVYDLEDILVLLGH